MILYLLGAEKKNTSIIDLVKNYYHCHLKYYHLLICITSFLPNDIFD